MRYTLDDMSGNVTCISCRDMGTAVNLFTAIHPSTDYLIIRSPRPDDKPRYNLVYLDDRGEAE